MSSAFSLPSLDEVLKIGTEPTAFERNALIYRPESPGIYYVLDGVVRVYRTTEDGQVAHVDFYPKGHFFGLSYLHKPELPETAVAHTGCSVHRWPKEVVETLVSHHATLMTALMAESFMQSARFYERLIQTQQNLIPSRLRYTLLDLAERIGTKLPNGAVTIEPSLTHQTLADIVGTSREIVTCHLNAFRRARAIDFSRKRIVVWVDALRNVNAARRSAAA